MGKTCQWAKSELMKVYHDTEWGVPLHDDKKLFEFLILEGAQAGLSWETILRRRQGYRRAFCNFNVRKVAAMTKRDLNRLIKDTAIIRNRLKIEAAISNARAFIKVQEKFGSFDAYIWQFVDGRPIQNKWKTLKQLPAQTKISQTMSKDLKKRGFRFVGPTICYAHMQATGMVNDHTVDCERYRQIAKLR